MFTFELPTYNLTFLHFSKGLPLQSPSLRLAARAPIPTRKLLYKACLPDVGKDHWRSVVEKRGAAVPASSTAHAPAWQATPLPASECPAPSWLGLIRFEEPRPSPSETTPHSFPLSFSPSSQSHAPSGSAAFPAPPPVDHAPAPPQPGPRPIWSWGGPAAAAGERFAAEGDAERSRARRVALGAVRLLRALRGPGNNGAVRAGRAAAAAGRTAGAGAAGGRGEWCGPSG